MQTISSISRAELFDALWQKPMTQLSEQWGNGALHWGEGFGPGVQAQLCGSSVNWLLTSYVLGIRPAKPGFSEAIFDPRAGSLTSAKGSVPTPHGLIKVEWQRIGDAIEARVESPKGVSIRSFNPKIQLQLFGQTP